MTRRPFVAAALAASVVLATNATSARAISVDCADRPSSPVGYELRSVQADAIATPNSAPSIAVLDTGVAAVPELSGRLRPGYNVVADDRNTNDPDGHGTAVASLAAASAGGVRGVSPTSPIIPITIFDSRGDSSPEGFVAAIARAVDANAGVINVSAAASPADIDAATTTDVEDAIYAAVSLGIPVVAATGNEGSATVGVPAAFPHVIAVGATDETGALAPFSNTGSALDLVAPGATLTTAAPSVICASGYATATGTSFAAPLVAGAAALLLAKHPGLDVGQLTDLLRFHGVRSPAWDSRSGFGMLDVAASLEAPIPRADQPEVNDNIKWAKLQPAVLPGRKRSATLLARIAPHTDPADVYRLKLKKGARLRVQLKVPGRTRLQLSFGTTRLKAKRGDAFAQRIAKSGTYFVGVAIRQAPPAGSDYTLSLKR